MQVGMIGLGRMGANMVRRFMHGGHQCVVHDVSQDAVQALAREGADGVCPRARSGGRPVRALRLAGRGRFQDRLLSAHAARVRRPPGERAGRMSAPHSDGLVIFGANGDLAYKKIFPALQAMTRRGHLDIPVVGVARSDWTLDQFQACARESVGRHGRIDEAAFPKLRERLDNITRGLLGSGGLRRYIDELSVTGLTSNPTIFDRAIRSGRDYDAGIREKLAVDLAGEGLFFELALDELDAGGRSLPAGPREGGLTMATRIPTPLAQGFFVQTDALIRRFRRLAAR